MIFRNCQKEIYIKILIDNHIAWLYLKEVIIFPQIMGVSAENNAILSNILYITAKRNISSFCYKIEKENTSLCFC